MQSSQARFSENRVRMLNIDRPTQCCKHGHLTRYRSTFLPIIEATITVIYYFHHHHPHCRHCRRHHHGIIMIISVNAQLAL